MSLTSSSPIEADLLEGLSREKKEQLFELLREKDRRSEMRQIDTYYPDEGPYRRELYQKHLEFFRKGGEHRERLALCANRVGKTEGMGGYETTLHLTGVYPDWWEGHRFRKPIRAWAAGKTLETTRDIQQRKLLGAVGRQGTGLIPGHLLKNTRPKAGSVPNCVDLAEVEHISGGTSTIQFKSYIQGRSGFEGAEMDWIWLDEEPPVDVYFECVTRTMKTGRFKGGLLALTFTPLNGMSEVVLEFLPGGRIPSS